MGVSARGEDLAVHPRVCGEHEWKFNEGDILDGSSPRVRGTLTMPRENETETRFIPACAGNTNEILHFPMMVSVHPRVCGEHKLLLFDMVAMAGSSPRVRGTPPRCHRGQAERRFIPACAGNTASHL